MTSAAAQLTLLSDGLRRADPSADHHCVAGREDLGRGTGFELTTPEIRIQAEDENRQTQACEETVHRAPVPRGGSGVYRTGGAKRSVVPNFFAGGTLRAKSPTSGHRRIGFAGPQRVEGLTLGQHRLRTSQRQMGEW